MLVLTRRVRESIVIDEDIRVTVVEIRGDKVRLAVDAPRETSVMREEFRDEVERHRAATAAPAVAGTPVESPPATASGLSVPPAVFAPRRDEPAFWG